MNLEFYSAGKSAMNGLTGATERADRPKVDQPGSSDRSPKFSDLLDQSKQDIKQAERQLQTARQNREESQNVTDDNEMVKSRVASDDVEAKTDESKEVELLGGDNLEDSSLLAVDNAQLVVQNLQGGLETGITSLSFNLNTEVNTDIDRLSTEPVVSTDMTSQGQNLISSEDDLMIDEFVNYDKQVSVSMVGISGSEENLQMEGFQGQLTDLKTGLSSDEGSGNKGNYQAAIQQNQSAGDQESQVTELQNKQVVMDDGELPNEITKEVKPEEFASAVEDLDSDKKSEGVQTNAIDKTENTIIQTENQNSGEKGAQEINLAGINQNKGSEVQPENKVEVAKQVEQKILQKFEPNKPMVIQMTLSPENLGEIEVQLKYDQGKLVIDILAASRETQNLLGQQINQLVKGLALQNVQVESVRLNVPVEQSSESQDSSSMMNSGSDPNQNQNETQLRESFIKHSRVMGNFISSSEDDETIAIPQNLQNYTGHRVNYLI